MDEYGVLSIIPPIVAIVLAIRTKQVIFSLILGLLIGGIILEDWNIFQGILATIEGLVDVFKSSGNARTILFTLLIGSLIQLIKYSGGVDGFVHYIQGYILKSKSPERRLQNAAGITGFLIFVESNISILTVGTVFQPLFDRFKVSRAKLAYLADSSSAPSCILFPLNAWGAYIMGLLAAFDGVAPFKTLIYSMPYNFYPLLTLAMVFFITTGNRDFGPMKQFEKTAGHITDREPAQPGHTGHGKARDMILPLLVMILSMPVYLIYTGWDSSIPGSTGERIWYAIGHGSGSSAVLYAVATALLFAGVMLRVSRKLNLSGFIDQSLEGMKEMLSMALLMVLAFAIGELCNRLGSGAYVASVTEAWLSPKLAPAIIFLTSCFIAFATGTSWGTFAIMMSIAIPLAQALDVNIYIATAAVLGGGVFGDHCSPISDTTLISSMASGCDHIDHVRTQLPYALVTGGLALALYLVIGFLA